MKIKSLIAFSLITNCAKLCFYFHFLRKPVQNWNICPIFVQIYLIPPEIFGNRTWILICQWIILFFISRHYKIKTLEITWNESNHLSNAEKWYKVYPVKRNIPAKIWHVVSYDKQTYFNMFFSISRFFDFGFSIFLVSIAVFILTKQDSLKEW